MGGGAGTKDERQDTCVCVLFVLARYPLANIKIILFLFSYLCILFFFFVGGLTGTD